MDHYCAGDIRVIDAATAARQGFSSDEIRRLRATGEWTKLRRGIDATKRIDPLDTISRHRAAAAAALVALGSSDAVVAHRSAAVLWQLEWLCPPDLSEVWLARPQTGTVRYYPGMRVLPAQLPPSHVTLSTDGLPICTPARTVIDLARHLSFRDSVVLAESAVRARLTDVATLAQILADCHGWPYTRRAKRTLTVVDGTTESAAEALARAVFLEAGLPCPRTQVDIRDERGTLIGRVDFFFPEFRTIVEIDGKTKYSDPEVLWREKRREDRLRELGYQVVRLSWADLIGPAHKVRERLLAAFARAR